MIFLTSLIFIFQGRNNYREASDISLQKTLSNEDALRQDVQPNFDNDIDELHNKINNFFVQDKLDSIQLDVTVDLLEPEA
jgi:hypothetical protein